MYYPMENIENFRDLGGIRTKDGKRVKDGMLFRCAALSSASENDIQKIKELGIDTVDDETQILAVVDKIVFVDVHHQHLAFVRLGPVLVAIVEVGQIVEADAVFILASALLNVADEGRHIATQVDKEVRLRQ